MYIKVSVNVQLEYMRMRDGEEQRDRVPGTKVSRPTDAPVGAVVVTSCCGVEGCVGACKEADA